MAELTPKDLDYYNNLTESQITELYNNEVQEEAKKKPVTERELKNAEHIANISNNANPNLINGDSPKLLLSHILFHKGVTLVEQLNRSKKDSFEIGKKMAEATGTLDTSAMLRVMKFWR